MKTKEHQGGTHASARDLFPKGVTETKEVVLEN
jgi:hypothetical protein